MHTNAKQPVAVERQTVAFPCLIRSDTDHSAPGNGEHIAIGQELILSAQDEI